jgi:hypothetical protein
MSIGAATRPADEKGMGAKKTAREKTCARKDLGAKKIWAGRMT